MRPIEWPSRVVKLFRITSGACSVGCFPFLWSEKMQILDGMQNYFNVLSKIRLR